MLSIQDVPSLQTAPDDWGCKTCAGEWQVLLCVSAMHTGTYTSRACSCSPLSRAGTELIAMTLQLNLMTLV